MRTIKKETKQQALLVVLLTPLLVFVCICGGKLHQLSTERRELKHDYADINGIRNGLLSVDRWRDNITELTTQQIDQFNLTEEQEDALRDTVSNILNSLITQVDDMFSEKQKTFGGKIKKFAFKTFVKTDKIREKVPEFSQTIIDEIKDPQNKRKLKFVAKSKIKELAKKTGDIDRERYDRIFAKYGFNDQDDVNFILLRLTDDLQRQTYKQTYNILWMLVVFLLSWVAIRKDKHLYRPMYLMSVILAFLVLCMGLSTPMIEIDARIQEVRFLLMGKTIYFFDQVIFFQSKSILDVVEILIRTGKIDSVIVGTLLLVFSILFPITKLISTEIYLFGKDRWKFNRYVRFFAFNSSKWSMADVMVVAIFMAYVGFNGILNNQLGNLNMNTHALGSIATNRTSLQPGFILFISFVVFSFILSEILKTNFSDFGESTLRKVRARLSKKQQA